MSDSITLCIVKDGAAGTSHGVTLTMEKRTISSVEDDCLVVTFTKGDTDGVTTTNNVQDMGGYAQLYVDGKIDTSATARLNLGTSEAGELQKGAFPQVFTAGYVTVKWYDKEGGTLLGMGSLTRGADGKDATVYGVQVSSYSEWISSGNKQQGLQFGFTKTTGTTVEKYTDVTKMGCTVKIYGDDTLYDNVSGWINEGNDNFLFSSFPYNNVVGNPTLADKSVISVELYHDDVLLATANYANGKQGALEISVDPDTLVFDTDDDGIVPSGTSKTATIACYRDGKKVTNVEYDLMEGGHPDCDASISTSDSTATVTISNIAKDENYGVSKTCGTVEVQVYDKDKGRNYFPTVKFAVNVAKFNGGLAADNKRFETTYNYLTNNGTSTDFSYYESHIKQTAKEISLHVSEKSVGRRNMLVGSAFRKQGEGFGLQYAGIRVLNGLDGMASVVATATSGQYSGVFWSANYGGRNVKIKRNTKYTLSAWVKCDRKDVTIALETIYKDTQSSTTRHDHVHTTATNFNAKEVNEWQFIQCTLTTGADYDFMEVNVWEYHSLAGVTSTLWISKIMLEEGEEYNGWTLSEKDYDYVGGNLIDNSAALTIGGNLQTAHGNVTQNDYLGQYATLFMSMNELKGRVASKDDLPTSATEGDRYAVTDTWIVYVYKSGKWQDSGERLHEDIFRASYKFEKGKDYVISWMAKGGGSIGAYVFGSSQQVFSETSDGNINDVSTYGEHDMLTTTEWQRYWMHIRVLSDSLPTYVIIRLYRNGDNSASSVYISQPKLEVGATVTEWTAKRSDMVDKQALYATGIDIDSKTIILTASNTTFRDNDGKELAVIDGEGLRATKIATTDNGGGHTEISGNSTVWYNKDGVTPGIKVFYDAAGVPHFQFCNSNGKVMYDFGPSGLQSFISSTQQAYSDECYLRSASSNVSTSGTKLSFNWLYVARNQSADLRYIYRKQIPTTSASSASEIYDGCVFTSKHKYEGTDWPATSTSLANSRLLPDGWYVEPNDGNLPMKIRPADDEGVFDPTQTVYYQTFYYYSSGKVTRTVRAYMKRTTSSQLVSKFTYAGSYDEI